MARWPSLRAVSLATLALLAVTTPSRAEDPPAAAPTAIAKPMDLENATCPVKGIPGKPGLTETVNGLIVHFCCPMCAAILNAVVTGTTNALAESANAKIQWIKRMAYGFRNRERFRNAIYFHCGGLNFYPDALQAAHTTS